MVLPSLENIRCFDAAATATSFRSAARRVGLTPAALGQRIRQLEDQLGARLFVRTTRSLTLTKEGLALQSRARTALEAAADCVRAGRGELPAPATDLTIGTRYELGRSFLVPNLRGLMAANEGLRTHLYFGSSADLFLRLRSREIDCAVTSARLIDPQLDSVRLHREDYVFVGSTKLLSKRPLVRDQDANEHTLIDHGPELPLFRYWIDAPHGGDRLRFKNILRIGTIGAIHDLVSDGGGVAVLPRYLVELDLAQKRLKILFPKVTLQFDYFRLVFRAEDPKRAIYQSVAEYLLRQSLR